MPDEESQLPESQAIIVSDDDGIEDVQDNEGDSHDGEDDEPSSEHDSIPMNAATQHAISSQNGNQTTRNDTDRARMPPPPTKFVERHQNPTFELSHSQNKFPQARSGTQQNQPDNELKSSATSDKHQDSAQRGALALDRPQLELSRRSERVSDSEDGHDTDRLDDDPENVLQPFDWDDLHRRSSDGIKERADELEKAFEEFGALTDLFAAWVEVAGEFEATLTRKRLKTEEMYVRQKEAEVDATRRRYMGVVDAFKAAIKLLD